MKIIAIGGEPATGKSFVMRRLIEKLEARTDRKWKTVEWSEFPKRGVIVLGRYDHDDVYGGTDRLSMAVQPQVLKFLRLIDLERGDWTVLFEGDRLFNAKFLEEVSRTGNEVYAIILYSAEATKMARRAARFDTKPESFLKGRKTKYARIAKAYHGQVSRVKLEVWPNENEADMERLIEHLQKVIAS